MTGDERRRAILDMLANSESPISGSAIGSAMGVSRQVVVQDIALLRSRGHVVHTTHYGYVLDKPSHCTRLLKVHHTVEQTGEELTTIVDLGGTVEDVVVNHRTYGKMSAELNIRNRRDVRKFLDDIETGKSYPLCTVTSGYHFHHIAADSEDILDEIEAALEKKGFLADFMPYEIGQI